MYFIVPHSDLCVDTGLEMQIQVTIWPGDLHLELKIQNEIL